MKLMAYTFVRTSEEIEAPWIEFDLDNARWTIPPERMKMGKPIWGALCFALKWRSSLDYR
jgi:hypothetical protein